MSHLIVKFEIGGLAGKNDTSFARAVAILRSRWRFHPCLQQICRPLSEIN
jgi:hypothetical protein